MKPSKSLNIPRSGLKTLFESINNLLSFPNSDDSVMLKPYKSWNMGQPSLNRLDFSHQGKTCPSNLLQIGSKQEERKHKTGRKKKKG